MTRRDEFLPDEAATMAFGARLAGVLRGGELILLEGDLGMGKTTLVRGLLRALGHEGTVKSPTYTLIEPYEFDCWRIYHLDLYRIADPGELDFIGLDELMDERAIVLVEWPERAPGAFRAPDYRITIRPQGEGRVVESQSNGAF
jgi:tRNA threonylcarbamoyladenosine biosynthesis protein TsaE